jgi:hypothetical protein
MINFYFADFARFVLAFILAFLQPDAAAHSSMVTVGDEIDGMTLTTGAADAPPLEAFCSNSPEGKGSYILDCRTPALASLGIGNIFLYADDAIRNLNWSESVWELSIDGQEVDLESFGTLDYVVPNMSKNASLGREFYQDCRRGTAWNIVLTDLKPGHHTLWFVALSDTESYTWFVNLEIEGAAGTDIGSVPFPPKS